MRKGDKHSNAASLPQSCSHKNSRGRQCKNNAEPGLSLCAYHSHIKEEYSNLEKESSIAKADLAVQRPKCPNCGKLVPSRATRCYFCKTTLKARINYAFIVLLLSIPVIFFGLGQIIINMIVEKSEKSATLSASAKVSETSMQPDNNDFQPSPKQEHIPTKSEAWSAAKSFVLDRLKSPSTATFRDGLLDGYQQSAEKNVLGSNGVFSVKMWVDSQNGFGAIVRTNCYLRIWYSSNGVWELESPPAMSQR